MRHRNYGGKLGRTSAHRKALLRNMVTALLDHERIETTHSKAQELRRVADRMITLGKRGDLHARRQALGVIRSRSVTSKLFDDLAERFRHRPGGYTRVLKLRTRVGDAAPLSIIELVDGKKAEAAPPKPRGRKAKAAAAPAKEPVGKKAPAKKAPAKPPAEKKASAKKPPAAKKGTGGTGRPARKKAGSEKD